MKELIKENEDLEIFKSCENLFNPEYYEEDIECQIYDNSYTIGLNGEIILSDEEIARRKHIKEKDNFLKRFRKSRKKYGI